MKDKLLITVAAAALFAGSSLALAQGKPPATGGAQMNAPPAQSAPGKDSTDMGAPGGKMAPSAQPPGKAETGSKPMTSERPAAAEGSRPSTTAQTNVNLTADQRTRIHSTVIKQANAPRVTSVNFKLSVGTVVPRSVHIVAVPAAIVEIQPAWRGYMYFLVGDQVVIVEPGTLRIVAVIAA